VPLILLGWYGSLAGLAAFTVAIAGFTLFVGVLTDRSSSLWPSVVAHGAWNGLVATSFAATEGVDRVPAFSGSDALLGEFGWLAAVTMFVLGLATAWWHTRGE
ncbi:MAG: CPBP family glutamic-type intramembrane protease, partial [Jiangellales bacterium]